jgi:uncharacterized RDD family membrane protein YckC
MDDAREWIATSRFRRPERHPAAQPGDPWGVGLPSPGAARAERGETAGLWRRAVALLLDLVVIAVLLRVVGAGLTAAVEALAGSAPAVGQAFGITWKLVVPAAYVVLAHGTGGQTLGKRLLGVRVVTERGEPVGYVHALGRFAAMLLAGLPAGLGWAIGLFRPDRRGLHDLVAGTRVVRAR